jgi:signal transduction histidine kinase
MARVTVASVSAARWLVGVLAGVVLCFLAATAVGEHLESAIAGRANLIIGNAMPSVQTLTTARGDLRQLELDLERYATIPADQRPELRDRIAATRQNIDAALSSYVSLPFFPNERDLYGHVERGLAGLDKQLADFLSHPDPAAVEHLHHAFDIVDAAILRVVSFDAAQGQRLGLEIQQVRGETRSIVVLLDAASVALAIGAAFLALRQLRRATRAQATEREARERHENKLVAQNEALGEFSGRVAHDVLSPLSTTMLALELLRHTCEKDPSACRMADRGTAAVTRVHTLVDGLLAFSRAGGQPEPGASTEIAPVIADVIDGLTGQARERRIELNVASVPTGSVACSSGILTSLISNLVRNAIKYMGDAPERRVDLRVIDMKDRWRVEVEDTGPGIPVEQQQKIFQPYVQLARRAEGIGLGLATVDRLVRAHTGSLGLISPPERGCLFWFELPKAISMRPELAPNAASFGPYAAT